MIGGVTITTPIYTPPAAKPRAKRKSAARGQFVARYDAAQTTSRNEDHWSRADARGPNNGNDKATRDKLAQRARYERDNNGTFDGLNRNMGADLIGTGPRLNLVLGDPGFYESARKVEKLYSRFCQDIFFFEKLRLLVEPQHVDGETFGQFITNDASPNPVKLDMKVMEQEQCATPGFAFRKTKTGDVDGIEFDKAGNPTFYHILREHPGESFGTQADRIPASQIVHWCRPKRPGQARCVTDFASSLENVAQTRDYSEATLTKAKTCANLIGVMKTNSPVDEDADEPLFEEMEEVPLPEAGLASLPQDWDAEVFDSGNTTTGYKEFVGEKNGELGRSVGAPYNVTVGNSSGYNYSSGRLDHVPYHRLVWIERHRLDNIVLIKFFKAWYAEALLLGLIPEDLPPIEEWEITFEYDAFDSIDPQKDADAWEKLLVLQVTTRTEICAARGLRFRDVIDKLAEEEAYMRSKGLDPAVVPTVVAPAAPKKKPTEESDEDTVLERGGSRA